MIGGIVIGVFAGPLVTERGTHAGDMTADDMNMVVDTMDANMDMEGMAMNPDPVEVAADTEAPTIEIVSATRDMMGAYSILIETTNFTFTPDRVDDEPIQNEGHAHIYVNDVKVGREYAPWIYVPASYFEGEGPYTITATLNANTHGEWTVMDAPIQATMIVD